ncbi:MAG TPA: ATP-binding protein [Lacunisphaera sp.]|nr:ATP-binding protein [Lacunisphaera sp.]
MKLQTKLLAGFAAVSGITLVAAGIGYWQTKKLSAALYEVGTVRLPASRALANLFEAKTSLDASKRELMRASTLVRIAADLSGTAADKVPPLPPGLAIDPREVEGPMDWRAVLSEELHRQERSWSRAEEGWRHYAGLPKTPAEAEKWQAFSTSWTAWRASYAKVMALLQQASQTGKLEPLLAAHQENQAHLFALARDSRNQLTDLVALNERIAEETKEASIASRHDAEVMQRFMLTSAIVSVAAALGAGIVLAQMILRGLRPMADAFSRIAAGDRQVQVPRTSGDEIGAMAEAMNGMVASLGATEAARKQAADGLAELADRLELALKTSQLGVWRRNLRTDTSQWDARMFELFGLPPAAAGPDRATILAMIVPEDRTGAAAYWSQIAQPGTSYQFRLRITRADGRRRHLEIHGRAQEMPGQPVEWLIGVVSDITDIVDASTESARLRERLAQAKKLETLGAQAASVAHDFNNLLTSIKGFIDLAALSLDAKHETSGLLREAQVGAARARTLVQRLLRQARNAGEVPPEPTDPGRLARESLALAAGGFPRQLTHEISVADGLPTIMADAASLQRVLINLCTNAAHAIGNRAGRIRVVVAPVELAAGVTGNPGCPAGHYVSVAVSDDGCGMDAAVLQHIFEPYYTTKSAGEGTGLGLAIASDIVAEHHGGLTVSSEPNVGTTFTIYLPVAQPAAVVGAKAAPATAA